MHFLVVGPGAMGCLFAAGLKKGGYEVTLLDYLPERARQIDNQGIVVRGITGEYTVKVHAVADKISIQPDVVLICVKSYTTKQAAEKIKPWLSPEAFVVTLQNGVGNLEILEQIFGKKNVFGGITAQGSTLLEPGKIRHAGQGETIIGPQEHPDSPLERIVSAFNTAGFKTRSTKNVVDLIWGKLIINVGINSLSALTRLKNGRLAELDGTRRVMEHAVKEAIAVAHAKNIRLPYPDPLARVMEVCRDTAENIASMLQDVLKQRITEVSFINGAIVREGIALGIPTPVNHTLTCLVKTVQETYDERI